MARRLFSFWLFLILGIGAACSTEKSIERGIADDSKDSSDAEGEEDSERMSPPEVTRGAYLANVKDAVPKCQLIEDILKDSKRSLIYCEIHVKLFDKNGKPTGETRPAWNKNESILINWSQINLVLADANIDATLAVDVNELMAGLKARYLLPKDKPKSYFAPTQQVNVEIADKQSKKAVTQVVEVPLTENPPGNNAPVFNNGNLHHPSVGKPFTLVVSATDEDEDVLFLDHEGSLPDDAVFIDQPDILPNGSKLFSWTPTESGTFKVTFTVSDGKAETVRQIVTIAVQDGSPGQQGGPGQGVMSCDERRFSSTLEAPSQTTTVARVINSQDFAEALRNGTEVIYLQGNVDLGRFSEEELRPHIVPPMTVIISENPGNPPIIRNYSRMSEGLFKSPCVGLRAIKIERFSLEREVPSKGAAFGVLGDDLQSAILIDVEIDSASVKLMRPTNTSPNYNPMGGDDLFVGGLFGRLKNLRLKNVTANGIEVHSESNEFEIYAGGVAGSVSDNLVVSEFSATILHIGVLSYGSNTIVGGFVGSDSPAGERRLNLMVDSGFTLDIQDITPQLDFADAHYTFLFGGFMGKYLFEGSTPTAGPHFDSISGNILTKGMTNLTAYMGGVFGQQPGAPLNYTKGVVDFTANNGQEGIALKDIGEQQDF